MTSPSHGQSAHNLQAQAMGQLMMNMAGMAQAFGAPQQAGSGLVMLPQAARDTSALSPVPKMNRETKQPSQSPQIPRTGAGQLSVPSPAVMMPNLLQMMMSPALSANMFASGPIVDRESGDAAAADREVFEPGEEEEEAPGEDASELPEAPEEAADVDMGPRAPGARRRAAAATGATRKVKTKKTSKSESKKAAPKQKDGVEVVMKIGGGRVGLDRYLIHCDGCIKFASEALDNLMLSGREDWVSDKHGVKPDLEKSGCDAGDRAKSISNKAGDAQISSLITKLEIAEVVAEAWVEIIQTVRPYLNSGIAGRTLENTTRVKTEMDSQPLVASGWKKGYYEPCFCRELMEQLRIDFRCKGAGQGAGMLRHVQVATSLETAKQIAPFHITDRMPERLPQYAENPHKRQDRLKSYWASWLVQERMFAFCVRTVLVYSTSMAEAQTLFMKWFKVSFDEMEKAEAALDEKNKIDAKRIRKTCPEEEVDCSSESEDLLDMNLGTFDVDSEEELAGPSAAPSDSAPQAPDPQKQFESDSTKESMRMFLSLFFPTDFPQAVVEKALAQVEAEIDSCDNPIIKEARGLKSQNNYLSSAVTVATGLVNKRAAFNKFRSDHRADVHNFIQFHIQTRRLFRNLRGIDEYNNQFAMVCTGWVKGNSRLAVVSAVVQFLTQATEKYMADSILLPEHSQEIQDVFVKAESMLEDIVSLLRQFVCSSLVVSHNILDWQPGQHVALAMKSLFQSQVEAVEDSGIFAMLRHEGDNRKGFSMWHKFIVKMIDLAVSHFHFRKLGPKLSAASGHTPTAADQELFHNATGMYPACC